MKRIICLFLMLILVFCFASCYEEEPLVEPINNESPVEPPSDERKEPIIELPTVQNEVDSPEKAVTDIAVDIMKALYDGKENILVSPVSISMALGMTAGGAKGETEADFADFLGRGITMNEMHSFYRLLEEKLEESDEVDIELANSIWARGDGYLTLNDNFLEFTDEYYGADVYLEPFDKSTVEKINGWVDDNTDGMIKEIIDEIDYDTVMYLINALSFEAEWQKKYEDTNKYFKFTNSDGEIETVTSLNSFESFYLSDDDTTGFIKNYEGGEYSFAVFLPNEGIEIKDYVASLSGERIVGMLENAEQTAVEAKLPKFTYSYQASLKDSLIALGFDTPFNPESCDISGIAESKRGNLYIGDVIHKTFIEVAEKGTKAAAVTAVVVKAESAMEPIYRVKKVTVNRPFVFAIVENATNTPLFLGTVLSVD